MKFIIIRHTSTDWNLAHRIQGRVSTGLNEQGRNEAKKLAEKLAKLNISKIVCSDLTRARQTAEIINEKLNLPIHFEKGLRECSFGELEGMTREETIIKYGKKIKKEWEGQYKSYDFRPFGGECCDDVSARHIEILKRYSGFNPKNTVILLVGHGRGLATLLAGIGHEPKLKRGEYKIIEY